MPSRSTRQKARRRAERKLAHLALAEQERRESARQARIESAIRRHGPGFITLTAARPLLLNMTDAAGNVVQVPNGARVPDPFRESRRKQYLMGVATGLQRCVRQTARGEIARVPEQRHWQEDGVDRTYRRTVTLPLARVGSRPRVKRYITPIARFDGAYEQGLAVGQNLREGANPVSLQDFLAFVHEPESLTETDRQRIASLIQIHLYE